MIFQRERHRQYTHQFIKSYILRFISFFYKILNTTIYFTKCWIIKKNSERQFYLGIHQLIGGKLSRKEWKIWLFVRSVYFNNDGDDEEDTMTTMGTMMIAMFFE